MRRFYTILSTVAATILVAASCFGNKDSVESSLDTLFGGLFPAGEPGAQVVVVRDGKIVYDKGFGIADIETGAPITDTTMFNICSISKQFSSMALFILEEEGKISLDDPVSKYFPHFKAPFYSRIALKNLISHTSGLPDSRPRSQYQWEKYRAQYPSIYDNVADYKLFCEEEESCRYLENLDSLAFEPGTAYEYQNPTFQLVYMIVEQVTGESFDTWMRDHIFLPAGMPGTVYFEPDRQIPNMAHGYMRDADGSWKEADYGETNFFGTKADGGIYTTALEFINWDKSLYGDVLVSSAMREAAHTGKIKTDIPDTEYGYGWFIETKPSKPRKIYHTGDNGGFYTFEGRFPDKDLFYLIFANQPHWDRDKTVESVDEIFRRFGWI